MSHEQIWSALDALAERHALSVSALARHAGLDPTAFNRSKRFARDGRPRWPSTESLFKVLTATGEDLNSFAQLFARAAPETNGHPATRVSGVVPLIRFTQVCDGGYFDDTGFPVGNGWKAIHMPDFEKNRSYALEVSGNSMLPFYRDGDTLIVSPKAKVRRHDRVVVRTKSGEVLAKTLQRKTTNHVELYSFNTHQPDRKIALCDIDWMARIVWASQ